MVAGDPDEPPVSITLSLSRADDLWILQYSQPPQFICAQDVHHVYEMQVGSLVDLATKRHDALEWLKLEEPCLKGICFWSSKTRRDLSRDVSRATTSSI